MNFYNLSKCWGLKISLLFLVSLVFNNINWVNYKFCLATAKAESTVNVQIPENDSLLPQTSIKRDLSPLEKRRVKREIVNINEKAGVELERGNKTEALRLWFRELRLQRAIGRREEIVALGKVANIAWEENRGSELKVISDRLTEIWQEIQLEDNKNVELITSIGEAYSQGRYLDKAIEVYQKVLVLAREKDDIEAEVINLEILGKLYLERFDYTEALFIYDELVNLTPEQNIVIQEKYLVELERIYDLLDLNSEAILVKQKLIKQYLTQNKIDKVVSLKISIADIYQEVEEIELAAQFYRESDTLAQSIQQFYLSTLALNKLANLYSNEDRLDNAIAVYREIIEIEKQTYNDYALLDTYDNLGKTYLKDRDYSQALYTFNNALKLARALNYRIDYFMDIISKINSQKLSLI